MSLKMATSGLLKITVFLNKGYDVVISVDDVTKKVLSRDSNYIVDVFSDQSLLTIAFLWEKLSRPQFYKDSTENGFFEGWSGFKFNNLGLALGTNLKVYTSVVKGLKLKVRKFWGLIPTLAEVTGEKLLEVGGLFGSPPPDTHTSWIGLKGEENRKFAWEIFDHSVRLLC